MYEELAKYLRSVYPAVDCGGCPFVKSCMTLQSVCIFAQAADAIEKLSAEVLSDRAILKQYGGETGIKDLNEFAGKYWDALAKIPRWIPVTEHLPKREQEVLICTEKKLVGKDAYIDSIVTPAIYEDGTMTENDSIWQWEDIDWAGWDEDEDCGIIPEGWWENRHFNPDGVYNNPVDRKVVAWMPLPEKYEPQKVEGAYKDV